MNQITPYEQLIAAKLEQLPPLPVMADEIWLRISVRLDEDMPTDDDDFGGDGPESGPDGGSAVSPDTGWKGWSIILLLGAVSLLIIYRAGFFSGRKASVGEPETNYRILEPAPVPEPGESPPGGRQSNTLLPPVVQGEGQTINPADSLNKPAQSFTAAQDSAGGDGSNDLLRVAIPVDSSASATLDLSVPNAAEPKGTVVPDQKGPVPSKIKPDSTTGRKRPSGIKGIGPDDYRIVPQQKQKDST